METISKSKRLRGVWDGLTVEGDVKVTVIPSKGWRVDDGRVAAGKEEWLASWWLNRDGAVQVNFTAGVADKGAILSAIDTFIAEAKAEIDGGEEVAE